MLTPSYNFWAIVIVFLLEKPSFRAASCWISEVVKGDCGLRVTCFFVISDILKFCSFILFISCIAWSSDLIKWSLSKFDLIVSVSLSLSAWELPSGFLILFPSKATNFEAITSLFSERKLAFITQYSMGLNLFISASLSQINRIATD